MNKSHLIFKFLLRTAIGVGFLFIIYLICAILFSPKLDSLSSMPKPSKDDLAALAELQDQTIDEKNPLRIQVDVDYSLAKKALWYPKEEAPILKELVKEGKLPPLEERIGPEPLVMRGLKGPGNYGGSMYRLNDIGNHRMKPAGLVRWSPQGYPIVPNLAKSFTVSENGKKYIFKLRKGVKWSDGHPFTSADILYFWEEEQCNKVLSPNGPIQSFIHRGRQMKVKAPDPYTVIFSFEEPNALFLETLATYRGMILTRSPKHFLEKYHPEKGDQELIREVMEKHNLINRRAVYMLLRGRVELPSMDPWIMKSERMTPPNTYVRNPYFWAVDEQGRQLPYVDRIVVNQKSPDMLVISASQGEVTAQSRYIRNDAYTMLMKQREKYGYQLYQWQNGDGAVGLAFNMNRRVPKGNKEVEHKAKLLKDKRFRQAMSMAVDKKEIIDAMFSGMGEPAAFQPAKTSPFYAEGIDQKYGKYNLEAANKLFDECGLTERDLDGFRKFPGGPSLLFDLNYCPFTGPWAGEFLVEYWRKVGIKVRLRGQDRSLFSVESKAALHDMSIWGGYGAFFPLLAIGEYFPQTNQSNFATKYATWYASGGMYNEDEKTQGIKPPEDHPCYQGMVLYEKIKTTNSREKQKELIRKMIKLAAENVYIITINTPLPALAVVKNGFNVTSKGVYCWSFLSPSNFGPETWYYDTPSSNPIEKEEIKNEISSISPIRPLHDAVGSSKTDTTAAKSLVSSRSIVGGIIKWGILLSLIIILGLFIVRYPFIGKRVVIMIPTLLIISIISFIVIELPPGDAINTKIMLMEEAGGQVDQKEINELKELFRTEVPAWKRYTWWMGFDWLVSYDRKDQGLLQGNMGRSMMDLKPVNEKVGDRLLFTFLISLGTILLTWAIALPIGIYSAVKQYSFFDYLFTIVGFIGMCIPGFLLALLLMFAAESLFGLKVSGLFSADYAAQSGWSMGKVIDLLKHLWLPIFVMGITGTAGMIRVMRANLLDELKKPYVITAKAKGVRPLKLLFKYPVRIALNPFISGIGSIFPRLISGGAIVAIVMSLPTIGPMQLTAIRTQDMYLAGSMLMVLSVLSVMGTLISDILLIALDPRIRFQGGGK